MQMKQTAIRYYYLLVHVELPEDLCRVKEMLVLEYPVL